MGLHGRLMHDDPHRLLVHSPAVRGHADDDLADGCVRIGLRVLLILGSAAPRGQATWVDVTRRPRNSPHESPVPPRRKPLPHPLSLLPRAPRVHERARRGSQEGDEDADVRAPHHRSEVVVRARRL